MASESMQNLLRTNYESPNTVPVLYWDMEQGTAGLKQPITYSDPRFPGEPISLGATAGYAMGETMANENNWYSCVSADCVTMQDHLGKSAYLDSLLIHQWNKNPEIVQIFLGFNTNPPSLRRYPGRPAHYPPSNNNQPVNPAYDPTIRGWYIEASSSANQPNTVFTAPYPDFHGLGWMITGAKALYPYTRPEVTSTEIGVIGIDILIEEIASVMNNIKFLDDGKLTLFTGDDGQVVTDVEWTPTANSIYEQRDPQGFFYYDLQSPSVTESTWNDIRSTPAGEKKQITIESPDGDEEKRKLIFVKHLSDYNAQYYLVVFVDESEIVEPGTPQPSAQPTQAPNRSINIYVISASIGGGVILMIVIYLWNQHANLSKNATNVYDVADGAETELNVRTPQRVSRMELGSRSEGYEEATADAVTNVNGIIKVDAPEKNQRDAEVNAEMNRVCVERDHSEVEMKAKRDHRESSLQTEMSVQDWLLKIIPDVDAPILHALCEEFRKDELKTYGDVLECMAFGTLDVSDIKAYISQTKLSKMKAALIIKSIRT